MGSADPEARYAELEAAEEDRRAARLRRQPVLLIALTAALTLGVAAVATVDLRRLRTPEGVALRWAQAATFGDCDDYLRFSTGPLDRPDVDLCRSLRADTADARQHNVQIGLAVRSVQVQGTRAVVVVAVTREAQVRVGRLDLRRVGDRWRVLRDSSSCALVGCA